MSLSHSELLQLKRWNTPTIYNGWEQITRRDCAADAFNLEETRDFMPQMGPMIGYAITLVIEPSHKEHKQVANAWEDYRKYVASQAGPKIVVVQDNDGVHHVILLSGSGRWTPGPPPQGPFGGCRGAAFRAARVLCDRTRHRCA